ncbi:MAG: hypothetical protein AAFY00_01695 [Bacteroidota bacterium]
MATRQARLSNAFAKLVAKLNLLKTEIGSLPGLSTTDKSNLVAAINEVKAIADGAAGGGASINDAVTNTVEAWSGSKVNNEIASAIAAALEGEDLSDLAQEIATLQATDMDLVSVLPQAFAPPQQEQARANIDAAHATEVGNTDYDFDADIDAAITF